MAKKDDETGTVATESTGKKYVSERGPFTIWEHPKLNPPNPPEAIKDDRVADNFQYAALAEQYGEQPTRDAITEMIRSYGNGISTTELFSQPTAKGMNLDHVWFGPNFPLFRHSHPAYGDCLYYILAGEIILGRRRLGAGSGFFVPKGQPYKYTAGPAGAEVLEFRADGTTANESTFNVDERSLDAIQRVVKEANATSEQWEGQAPNHIGDTTLRQAEIDAE